MKSFLWHGTPLPWHVQNHKSKVTSVARNPFESGLEVSTEMQKVHAVAGTSRSLATSWALDMTMTYPYLPLQVLPPKFHIDTQHVGLENVAPFKHGYFRYLC